MTQKTTDPLIPMGLYRDENHNYYWNQEGPFIGITTNIDSLDKSGPLVGWAKREVATCAVRNYEQIGKLIAAGGTQAAIEYLKGIPDYIKDTAADLGSRVHYYFELHGQGKELPDIKEDEAQRVALYTEWVERYKPRFLYNEFRVISLKHRYGGTGDVILELWCKVHERWCTWMVDYKTGNGVYGKTALQLVALQEADFMATEANPTTPIPIPRTDHYGVFHINASRCDLYEYEATQEEWEAFLYTVGLTHWIRNREGKVKHNLRTVPYGVPPE